MPLPRTRCRPLTARIEELLERVDMRNFADVPLGKYSKGMLQRVGLCQTLLHDPDVILLDEPMSGLDPVGRAMVRDIILEEQAAGRTVFFCSHVLSDVESICERVAILVGGKIQTQGKISDLIESGEKKMVCVFQIREGSIEDLKLSPDIETIPKGGLWQVVLSESAFGRFIQDNASSISIVDVRMQRRSLEELFVDAVQEQRAHSELGVLA